LSAIASEGETQLSKPIAGLIAAQTIPLNAAMNRLIESSVGNCFRRGKGDAFGSTLHEAGAFRQMRIAGAANNQCAFGKGFDAIAQLRALNLHRECRMQGLANCRF
jgi:hypothetical protein